MAFARLFTKRPQFLFGFALFGYVAFFNANTTKTAPLFNPEHEGIFLDQKTYPQMTAYLPAVFRFSKEENISAPLALAVIKQESHFNPRARSSQGALGLMQLMPTTAQNTITNRGGKSNIKSLNKHLVERPDINIGLGIHYLASLKQKLSGVKNRTKKRTLLLASYNAGLHRVAKAFGCQSIQCLTYKTNYHGKLNFAKAMATLPRETNHYVSKVLHFEQIYTEELLANKM